MIWWHMFTSVTAGFFVGMLLATAVTYRIYNHRSKEVSRLADNTAKLNNNMYALNQKLGRMESDHA